MPAHEDNWKEDDLHISGTGSRGNTFRKRLMKSSRRRSPRIFPKTSCVPYFGLHLSIFVNNLQSILWPSPFNIAIKVSRDAAANDNKLQHFILILAPHVWCNPDIVLWAGQMLIKHFYSGQFPAAPTQAFQIQYIPFCAMCIRGECNAKTVIGSSLYKNEPLAHEHQWILRYFISYLTFGTTINKLSPFIFMPRTGLDRTLTVTSDWVI